MNHTFESSDDSPGTSPGEMGPGQLNPPALTYQTRRDHFAAARMATARRAHYLSHARVVLFLLAIALGVWVERAPALLPIALVILALIGFFLLIALHRRARRREEWFRELAILNELGLRRLERDWDALPVRPPTRDLAGHPYAGDLDIYGRASLTQLLGPVSGIGATVVDDWLLDRTDPTTIYARQEALRELAPNHDLREELAAYGRRAAGAGAGELDRFLRWAEVGIGPDDERAGTEAGSPGVPLPIRWGTRLIPLSTIVFALLQLTGVVEGSFWLIGIAAALALTLGPGRDVQESLHEAASGEALIRHYPALLELIEHATFQAPLLRELRGRISGGEDSASSASQGLARLAQLLHLADLRHSAMLYFPVQLITLWDFHIGYALDRWRDHSGDEVRGWIEAAGELEALASLAVLAHDHPDWAFAEFRDPGDEGTLIEAEGIGHPLLPDSVRVDNDVRIGPPGTFLLVTGSNMSGKSTLLRSVGTNVVLAQAGAPSCAHRLVLPPIELWSAIRIEDSLARGVSHFMAELQRLKEIVDAARRLEENGFDENRPRLLFLIDEILSGTNTAERQIAARRVVRHLVDAGALGVVTTHDLDLARGPELVEKAELVHFRERVQHREEEGGRLEMTFDYKLRPGLATSSNALVLLEFVGLPGNGKGLHQEGRGSHPDRNI